MTRWLQPDIQNAVRELSKQVQRPTMAHAKAMHRVMKYCVDTVHMSPGILARVQNT